MLEFKRSQRKRRSNSKEYGSFETDFNHHKPEAQDKCILCSHKDDLDNCVEYMKKSREEGRKLITWKEQCFGCYEPISMSQKVRTCNNRQKCQVEEGDPTVLHGYTAQQKAGDDNSGV